MKQAVVLIVLSCTGRLFAQNEIFAENAWGSLVWNHQIASGWQVTTDAGIRLCDRFIRQRRQTLVRTTILYAFRSNWSAGGGFAWFQHGGRENVSQEYRPFLQLGYQLRRPDWKFTLRLRNELRFYPDNKSCIDRTRLQGNVSFALRKKWLNPGIGVEGFVSATANPLSELRLTAGNSIAVSENLIVHPFYTLQRQSTIYGNQHIIGLQLIVGTGKNQ
jgi:hypothetical protein